MTTDARVVPPARVKDAEGKESERELLLALLAQQQRVAQVGLITSSLVHDVNGYLTRISGTTYLALEGSDPEEWRTALSEVQEQCSALTQMVRAFLTFVKRQERFGEGRFLMSHVVTEACCLAAPLAHSHGATLSHTILEDAHVEGDKRLATQAVVNLVSNAIQAVGGRRGEVQIVASCPAPKTCRLVVRDDGPGIPDTVMARLFRPFATMRKDGEGNGLGLFIVSQVVRRLGGSIRVASSSEGTEFQIDLPRA